MIHITKQITYTIKFLGPGMAWSPEGCVEASSTPCSFLTEQFAWLNPNNLRTSCWAGLNELLNHWCTLLLLVLVPKTRYSPPPWTWGVKHYFNASLTSNLTVRLPQNFLVLFPLQFMTLWKNYLSLPAPAAPFIVWSSARPPSLCGDQFGGSCKSIK